jgi:MOSC domain-containing protein YiiM
MPREGIFAKVLESGPVAHGDLVTVLILDPGKKEVS